MEIQLVDWGRIDYAEAWSRQTELFNERVQAKLKSPDGIQSLPDVAVFCEHPPVYTLGKSGIQENLLINMAQLEAHGAGFFKIDRGGDITFHGPGQLVVYPIFDLEHWTSGENAILESNAGFESRACPESEVRFDSKGSIGLKGRMGLKAYIHKLEEAVIRLLRAYGLEGSRLEGATGVWIDADSPFNARKICAIGVKSSRFITMHGLAFNVNTDLSFFNAINPCGFVDKGVTSLAQECGRAIDMAECKQRLFLTMKTVFAE